MLFIFFLSKAFCTFHFVNFLNSIFSGIICSPFRLNFMCLCFFIISFSLFISSFSLRSNIFRDGMNMNTFNQLYANDHHRPFEIQSNQLHSRKFINNKLPFMPSHQHFTSQSNIINIQMQTQINMNRPDQYPPYWQNVAQYNRQRNSISNRFGGYLIKHNFFQMIKSTLLFLLGYTVFIYIIYVNFFLT